VLKCRTTKELFLNHYNLTPLPKKKILEKLINRFDIKRTHIKEKLYKLLLTSTIQNQ